MLYHITLVDITGGYPVRFLHGHYCFFLLYFGRSGNYGLWFLGNNLWQHSSKLKTRLKLRTFFAGRIGMRRSCSMRHLSSPGRIVSCDRASCSGSVLQSRLPTSGALGISEINHLIAHRHPSCREARSKA